MDKNSLPSVLKSKTPKTYKNKKLNNANFGNFTHNDYQVFLHLVSKIGGVDEEGNPVYQGIDQSKLVPLLVASLQEALVEIDNLKARIEVLENV